MPQKLKYSVRNTFYPPALLIPEEMTSCKTINTTKTSPKLYILILEIGIPAGVISAVLVTIYVVYKKRRKQFNEELILQNIFDLRSNQKIDHQSQKLFDDEISMIKKININQISKGNQIGNLGLANIQPHHNF